MDRKTKEQVVVELHEKLKHFNLAVLANCSGLNVEKITTLRNALRKTDTEFRVVKNTLLRIASKETDLSGMQEHFKGPLAIALNYTDAVETAKVLIDFAKKNADLEIRAGIQSTNRISADRFIRYAHF